MHTKIQITIDGQKVEGEITYRCASDICVKITKPYQDVSRGLHIPYFARPHASFDADYGDKTATDLLESIYHLCKFTFENLDSLTDQYLKIKKRIKHLEARNISEWVFKSKRIKLRKLLKSGEIDNIEYQKQLTGIRKAYEEFESKKDTIWHGFFHEYFPMTVPVGTRDDILRIFEDNTRTTSKETDKSDFISSGKEWAMSGRVLLGSAYFIHPYRGQVIYVPHSHISLVISNPEKFHLNFDYIKAIYEKYDERIGLEGKARREILIHLINQGFIRIRKYKNQWKVNVKNLFGDTAAIFLHRWAKSMIAATDDFHIEVIIEQKSGEIIKTDMTTLASYQFAGRPKNRFEALSYTPGPFLLIDEVEPGTFLP
jgi:hypothetical protein